MQPLQRSGSASKICSLSFPGRRLDDDDSRFATDGTRAASLLSKEQWPRRCCCCCWCWRWAARINCEWSVSRRLMTGNCPASVHRQSPVGVEAFTAFAERCWKLARWTFELWTFTDMLSKSTHARTHAASRILLSVFRHCKLLALLSRKCDSDCRRTGAASRAGHNWPNVTGCPAQSRR